MSEPLTATRPFAIGARVEVIGKAHRGSTGVVQGYEAREAIVRGDTSGRVARFPVNDLVLVPENLVHPLNDVQESDPILWEALLPEGSTASREDAALPEGSTASREDAALPDTASREEALLPNLLEGLRCRHAPHALMGWLAEESNRVRHCSRKAGRIVATTIAWEMVLVYRQRVRSGRIVRHAEALLRLLREDADIREDEW
jgi:hypothetical protein